MTIPVGESVFGHEDYRLRRFAAETELIATGTRGLSAALGEGLLATYIVAFLDLVDRDEVIVDARRLGVDAGELGAAESAGVPFVVVELPERFARALAAATQEEGEIKRRRMLKPDTSRTP